MSINFTFSWYGSLLALLYDSGYEIANYHNWHHKDRCVILRHDVDEDLLKAMKLAHFESEQNVVSTYFVLLSSDFYNVFSKEAYNCLKNIRDCGCEIGLHFDEVRYYPKLENNINAMQDKIKEECEVLSQIIEEPIRVVSMHRPSKNILEADVKIPNIINSYGKIFFSDFKYLSDSRHHWREPVEEIIKAGQHKRLHILTHAFWYNETELSLHDSIYNFVNNANRSRYDFLYRNITDLPSIMQKDEVR